MTQGKRILDACCGSKMFWFDRSTADVVFVDIREENHVLCDGRELEIKPDIVADFRQLPFDDERFSMVVFDPPHFKSLGQNSWMAKKYVVLNYSWKDDLKRGFDECMRVLKTDGTLIFKWNETQIPTKTIIEIFGAKPLIGHPSGKASKTHWITYMK